MERRCSVVGCERPYRARGYCPTHWRRWRIHGEVGDAIDQRTTRHTPRFCSIEGCGNRHLSRGWCEMHYMRWYTTGTTELRPMATPEERFWLNVQKFEGSCWIWQAHLIKGYGHLWLNGGSVMVHRFSYEMHVGPIPPGLTVDHLCFNRPCVNPMHLRVVTKQFNCGRSLRKLSPRCTHGHLKATHYSQEQRKCRRCAANRAAGRPVEA